MNFIKVITLSLIGCFCLVNQGESSQVFTINDEVISSCFFCVDENTPQTIVIQKQNILVRK